MMNYGVFIDYIEIDRDVYILHANINDPENNPNVVNAGKDFYVYVVTLGEFEDFYDKMNDLGLELYGKNETGMYQAVQTKILP